MMDVRQTRVEWVDTAKGVGIFLVVVGHVIRGLETAQLTGLTSPLNVIDVWIYSFHMPLFFFLSGIFLVRSVNKSSFNVFASDKVRTIAYPYFTWSILAVLLKSMLGAIPNTPRDLSDLFRIAYEPVEQFWFLYVLFIVTILLGALYKLGLRPWLVVLLAILVYPSVLSFSPPWGVLELARRNAIYVATGASIGWYYQNHLSKILEKSLISLMSIVVFGYGFTAACVQVNDYEILTPVVAFSGTMATIAFALILNRVRIDSMVNFVGRHSLEIYVAHTMASAGVRIGLQSINVRSPIIHLLAGVSAGMLFPLALALSLNVAGIRFAFGIPKNGPFDHRM